MNRYRTPGVYKQDVFPAPARELRTGVPVLIGLFRKAETDKHAKGVSLRPLAPGLWLVRPYAGRYLLPPADSAAATAPEMLARASQFEERLGVLATYGYLAHAASGFFQNGGRLCFVQAICYDDTAPSITARAALDAGLGTLAALDTLDLVCAPDIMRTSDQAEIGRMQAALLKHCDDAGDRFAILDWSPGVDVLDQRNGLSGTNGALYYPWVRTAGGLIPPCGHVAGVYARSDERVGVHKAPANEIVAGVLDVQPNLSNLQQERLNPSGINCLRSFPGRGIRVWGARTLSREADWTYINVRRLFLTAGRWIERTMASAVFEPNDLKLWARIRRDLTAYFNSLFQRGALKGSTPQEAFFVKCDAETNPPDARDRGEVVAEVGLAPGLPNEFVVVRIIHGAGGVTIAGPALPG